MQADDLNVMKRTMQTMQKARKAGLLRDGEGAAENQAYKLLKNKGWMQKLSGAITAQIDASLSLSEDKTIS